MIDIVLINSPIHDYTNYPKFATSYSTPVGLLYLATVLKENNFSVEIVDAEFKQLTPAEIAEIVNGKSPKYVGFNLFTVNYKIVEGITNLISDSIEIVIGGPHVSAMPITHFENHFKKVKVFVKNDGEYKLLEILNGTDLKNIPKIYFRENEKLFESSAEDFDIVLDELPIPDRTFLESEPYLKDGKPYMDISISRGCVFACTFCAGSCKTNGTTYKRRNIESIKNEILFLIKNYGIVGLEIVDDLPFYRSKDLDTFLDFIEHERLEVEWEVNFPFLFLRNLTPEQFQRISKNGIRRISVGIESGSEEIRKLSGKNIPEDELLRVMSELFNHSISTKGYFILGFPNEKKEQMNETIALAKKLFSMSFHNSEYLFRPRIFMYKPFPKTGLWTELVMNGYDVETLLSYADFEVDVKYFNKHAWGSTLQLSDVEPKEITDMINHFYTFIDKRKNNYDTAI